MFAVDGLAGVNINQYKFDRYTDAYLGIRKMLKSVGYKLAMSFDAVSRKTILKVGYRTTAVNGRYIRGFGVPNFKSKATESTPTAPAPKVTPIKTSLPELKRGSGGAYVEAMQNALLYLGYTSLGSADGDFGAKTEKAVINFQNKHNLVPDGICGPVTWQAILKALPTLRRGMNNKAVKALQLILKVRGYTDDSDESLKVDGSFGSKTEQATKKMQKAYNLEPDGICGPLTKAKF